MRERQLNTQQVQLTTWPSVDRFFNTTGIPEGYLVVHDDGVPIDMFYKSRGADTTVVCFHGAAGQDVRLPWLVGGGVLRDAAANRLSISDPSLYLYEDAQNAWFIGSEKMPLLQYRIEDLIRHVATATGARHLVFFGGSSGGFAALAMSLRFPGSLALPMNPQTVLERHHRGINKYLSMAWPGVPSVAGLPEYVVTDLAAAYAQGHNNTVGYIQNRRDRFHIKAHQEPFFEQVGPLGRLLVLEGEWGQQNDNGHVPPPRSRISMILGEVSASGGRWGEALKVSGFAPASLF